MAPRLLSCCLALALLPACTTLTDVSSGQVGCAPERISISDEQTTWGGRTWTASCDGRVYHCSAHGGGEGSTAQVSCTPAEGTAVPGGADAVPAAGCQYDTQCKGDRICEQGVCVDPTP